MSLTNQTHTYGAVAKCFHWLIVLLVIITLIMGAFRHDIPHSIKGTWMGIHKSLGMTILFLMILRLVWKWLNIAPDHPPTMRAWESFAASLVHFLFYVFLLLMPIVGFIGSNASKHGVHFWWWFSFPNFGIPHSTALSHLMWDCHTAFAWVILALIIVHVAAVCKHYFIDKDRVLQSMLP